MSDEQNGLNRGQFIRNAAKGSLVLVGSGGVVASMTGVAYAKTTKTDLTILQTAFIAETLAVEIYSAIVDTYFNKLKLDPGNLSYFKAALVDEKEHLHLLKGALGKSAPKGFKLEVPAKYVRTKNDLAGVGKVLEEAFVSTYLGAVKSFNSQELKSLAAGIATNEATHFSFFDAILPGANAVLPAFGPKTLTAGEAAAALKAYGFLK
jgi:rubrerythrin